MILYDRIELLRDQYWTMLQKNMGPESRIVLELVVEELSAALEQDEQQRRQYAAATP